MAKEPSRGGTLNWAILVWTGGLLPWARATIMTLRNAVTTQKMSTRIEAAETEFFALSLRSSRDGIRGRQGIIAIPWGQKGECRQRGRQISLLGPVFATGQCYAVDERAEMGQQLRSSRGKGRKREETREAACWDRAGQAFQLVHSCLAAGHREASPHGQWIQP